jgi:hypothetical protein
VGIWKAGFHCVHSAHYAPCPPSQWNLPCSSTGPLSTSRKSKGRSTRTRKLQKQNECGRGDRGQQRE